jgi:hypothetical protein
MGLRYLSKPLQQVILGLLTIGLCLAIVPPASAFCGFFVARSAAKLDNSASRVVIVREGNRSVFTMANNFQGDVQDFARIVPIPVLPKREQIRIGDNKVIDQIDAFTAPRLQAYEDNVDRMLDNNTWQGLTILGLALSCVMILLIFCKLKISEKAIILFIFLLLFTIAAPSLLNQANKGSSSSASLASESVKVMDQFTVGDYDVVLLDAAESDDLANWLTANGYKLPQGAEAMLNSYIQQGMKFFVVKINLAVLQKTEHAFLRPIVIEYESPKLVLPMRLSTLNATSDQDLTIYILAPNAVAEVANYPTVPIPTDGISGRTAVSGQELPSFVKIHFGEFYHALFQKAYEDAGKSAVLMEFAGQLGKCDPCNMDRDELQEFNKNLANTGLSASKAPITITRLHIRYNQQTFPKDLEFRLVGFDKMKSRLFTDQTPTMQWQSLRRAGTLLQSRYVIREPSGSAWSFSRLKYQWQMRHTEENLARLTSWNPEKIRQIAAN